MTTFKILGALTAALGFAVAGPANAAELVTNGSFETGDFTGWTLAGNTGFTGVECPGVGFAGQETALATLSWGLSDRMEHFLRTWPPSLVASTISLLTSSPTEATPATFPPFGMLSRLSSA
jgi:hypothetical protein